MRRRAVGEGATVNVATLAANGAPAPLLYVAAGSAGAAPAGAVTVSDTFLDGASAGRIVLGGVSEAAGALAVTACGDDGPARR